jgi:hypothetical protein
MKSSFAFFANNLAVFAVKILTAEYAKMAQSAQSKSKMVK